MTLLIVMAGLPGSGKSTVARELATRLPAALVAVDPIDDAMRRAGIDLDQPTGLAAYVAAEAVADDVLGCGLAVVLDAVNAVEPARRQWRDLATRRGVPRVVVEVGCSDPSAHRARLAARSRGLIALPEPGWHDVQRRAVEYAPWTEPVVRVDSAEPIEAGVAAVLQAVAAHGSDRR